MLTVTDYLNNTSVSNQCYIASIKLTKNYKSNNNDYVTKSIVSTPTKCHNNKMIIKKTRNLGQSPT